MSISSTGARRLLAGVAAGVAFAVAGVAAPGALAQHHEEVMECRSSDGGCVDLTKPSGLINPFGGTVVNNPSCPDLTGSAGG